MCTSTGWGGERLVSSAAEEEEEEEEEEAEGAHSSSILRHSAKPFVAARVTAVLSGWSATCGTEERDPSMSERSGS